MKCTITLKSIIILALILNSFQYPYQSLFVSTRNVKYSCYKANGHTQSSSASNSQVVMETPTSTTPTKFKVIPCMLHWLQTVEQK